MTEILLSAQSRRLWHQERADSKLQVLLQPDCYLFGDTTAKRIAEVITQLMERHEALRMGVVDRGGEPFAVYVPPIQPAIFTNCIDADDVAWQTAIERAGEDHHAQLLEAPAGSPLCRFSILQRTKSEFAIVVTLHHMIADGWSIGLLAREFLSLMEGSVLGRTPRQLSDFINHERAELNQADAAERLSYWDEFLARRDNAWGSLIPSAVEVVKPDLRILGAEAAGAVERMAVLSGASKFAVLLTCFAVALCGALQTSIVRIGIPVANRSGAGMKGVCGLLATTLLVDLTSSMEDGPVAAIRRTRQALEAAARRRVPLAHILERLHDDSYLSQGEVAHAQFNMLPIRESMLQSESMRIVPALIRPISSVTQQDLSLMVVDAELGLLIAETHRPTVNAAFVSQVMQEFLLWPERLLAAG